MKRNEFEHIIAAAANVISEDEFVVGSQAVLGSTSAVPDSMLVSMEADIYPAGWQERLVRVDVPPTTWSSQSWSPAATVTSSTPTKHAHTDCWTSTPCESA